MENRREWLKRVPVSLAASLALGGITPLTESAQAIEDPTLGTEQEASYVIFIDSADGNKIKAKNGRTGNIDYSGTDAATVMQNAISALNATGGVVFIKEGAYDVATPLTWTQDKTLILRGMGMFGTILNWTGGAGSVLNFDPGSFVQFHGIVLEDFQVLVAGCTNITAVSLNRADMAYLKGIFARSTGGGANSFGFYTDLVGNHSLVMVDCRSSNFDVGYKIHTDHVFMARCQAAYGSKGYWFASAGAEIAGVNLTTYHQSNGPDSVGFHIDWGAGAGQLTLISPFSENQAGGSYAPTDYKIQVGHENTNVVLVCPDAARKPPVINVVGSTNNLQCIGRYFRNLGTATFSGDRKTKTFTIAHGLATTPRKYFALKAAPNLPVIDYLTADSKNISVNFTTAPNNSSKNNVVLVWDAEI